MSCMRYFPDLRIRNLAPDVARRILVGLDSDDKKTGKRSVRLDLSITVRAIRLRRKRLLSSLRTEVFYIGCRSLAADISAPHGRRLSYTPARSIPVSVTGTESVSDSAEVGVSPTAEAESGNARLKLNVGSLKFAHSGTESSSFSYKTAVTTLEAVPTFNSVEWEFQLPPKAPRAGFVTGTLALSAEFTWSESAPSRYGRIRVGPYGVDYFNSEHRPLRAFQRLMVEYLLQKPEHSAINISDTMVNFVCDSENGNG